MFVICRLFDYLIWCNGFLVLYGIVLCKWGKTKECQQSWFFPIADAPFCIHSFTTVCFLQQHCKCLVCKEQCHTTRDISTHQAPHSALGCLACIKVICAYIQCHMRWCLSMRTANRWAGTHIRRHIQEQVILHLSKYCCPASIIVCHRQPCSSSAFCCVYKCILPSTLRQASAAERWHL